MIDCLVVTHGDADHFAGLTEISKSEKNAVPKKRLFIAPRRVYHNGLVKRPTVDAHKKNVPDSELLGPTKVVDGETILTGLVDSLLAVPDEQMNAPFRRWKDALSAWNDRSPIEFRRLSCGQDDAFDFFNNADLSISVLAPIMTEKGDTKGLKFLGEPPKGPRVGHESLDLVGEAFNDEAGRILAQKHEQGKIDLRSEVFKVPHHGSADFSGAFLHKVSPIISVVSSGDESAKKEYIHPRATLMGALGRHSRVEEPLVFVTELVAFFNLEGWARVTEKKKDKKRGEFFAFSRTAYGIVKTRTDGNRMLVYTDSGKADLKEAYCYRLDAGGLPVPAAVRRV